MLTLWVFGIFFLPFGQVGVGGAFELSLRNAQLTYQHQ
jgi:hypothetical protein